MVFWPSVGLMSSVSGIDKATAYGRKGTVTVRPQDNSDLELAVQFADGSVLYAPFCNSYEVYDVTPSQGFTDGTWFAMIIPRGDPRMLKLLTRKIFWVNDLR
jgi:hypothetical protein